MAGREIMRRGGREAQESKEVEARKLRLVVRGSRKSVSLSYYPTTAASTTKKETLDLYTIEEHSPFSSFYYQKKDLEILPNVSGTVYAAL